MGMDQRYSVKISHCIQGIALLMMIYHHAFSDVGIWQHFSIVNTLTGGGGLNNDLLGSVRCASHSLRGLPATGSVHH